MAGEYLFGRIIRVTIIKPVSTPGDFTHTTSDHLVINGTDDPTSPGNRVKFKITKTTEKNPNPGELVIINLAPLTRASLQDKGVRVIVEAGYKDKGLALLGMGDVRIVDHQHPAADWVTTIKFGDSERAIRYARASEVFAAGATVGDVVNYLAGQMGIPVGNAAQQAVRLSTKFFQGYTVHGPASSELDRVLRSVGYTCSYQDGQVQILGPGESLTNSVPEVSVETCLLGSPELGSPEKKGKTPLVKFTSYLLPEARAGGRVLLRSQRFSKGAVVRLKKVEHEGDIRGDAWYSHMEGIADTTATAAP